MDGEDVWRVASSYGSDDGGFPRDNRTLNTIMLRFRPIAPKPVSDGSVGSVQVSQSKGSVSAKRVAKRKYVRVRRSNRYVRKNNNKSPEKLVESRDGVAGFMTLQLMPEESSTLAKDLWCKNLDLNRTVEKIQILDSNLKPPCLTANVGSGSTLDRSSAVAPVVESLVIVEIVTGTCMGGSEEVLGCTDAEKVRNLETDTCPGFISDGYWKVRWVNDAFKKMIVREPDPLRQLHFSRSCENPNSILQSLSLLSPSLIMVRLDSNNCRKNTTVGEDQNPIVSEEEKETWPEIVVWLKVNDDSVWRCCYSYPSFTCSVRLQYTWRNEKCTKMVPCDVWRLESGGFAWRLDVKAALSLGL